MLPGVLHTALENQLSTPVPQPRSFDDSPALEAPSIELVSVLCRTLPPSFVLFFSSNVSPSSLERLRFRRPLGDVSSLPERVEGRSPASPFINCTAGPAENRCHCCHDCSMGCALKGAASLEWCSASLLADYARLSLSRKNCLLVLTRE